MRSRGLVPRVWLRSRSKSDWETKFLLRYQSRLVWDDRLYAIQQ